MTKHLMTIIALAGLLLTGACTVEGGIVSSRPDAVVYTRPVAPGADFIWVDGDWVWTGGAYRWREGYWSRPRGHRVWEGGRWESANNGWKWRRGHWR